MKKMSFLSLAVATALLAGCANPGVMQSSAMNYNTMQAGQLQQVQTGTVISLMAVNIAPSHTGVGTTGGALAGAVAGSSIGGGRGSLALGLIGAVVGGIAGSMAEGHVMAQKGEQITIRLDSGNTVAVTQAADIPIKVGDRVEILTSGYGHARVIPIQEQQPQPQAQQQAQPQQDQQQQVQPQVTAPAQP